MLGFLPRPSVNSLCFECKMKTKPPTARARSLRQTSRTFSKAAVPEGSQLDIVSFMPHIEWFTKIPWNQKAQKESTVLISQPYEDMQEAGDSTILQ